MDRYCTETKKRYATRRSARRASVAENFIYNMLVFLSRPAVKACVLGLLILAAIGIVSGLQTGAVSVGTGIVSVLLISLGIFVI